jgi:hypothetical protein
MAFSFKRKQELQSARHPLYQKFLGNARTQEARRKQQHRAVNPLGLRVASLCL